MTVGSILLTGDRPTLPQLMFLECPDGTIIRIIDRTSPNWNSLGLGLEFEGHVLQTINQNAFHQANRACQSLLQDWLEGKGKNPVTWETLIKALGKANFPQLVQELKKAFNLQPVDSTTGESLIPKVHNLQTLCSKQ